MAVRKQGNAPVRGASQSVNRRIEVGRPKPSADKTPKPEVRIFVSYSHQDVRAEEKLHTHLAPWRNDSVTVWHEKKIESGGELDVEIARELRHAHIFVALFSPAYFDSNYCWNIEYKRAMSRRARKLMRVVAVVVKPYGWKQTRAARFKLLPKDGVPPERWSSSDAAFLNVAEGIGEVIKSVRRELAAQPAKRFQTKLKPSEAAPAAPGKARTKSTANPRSRERRCRKAQRSGDDDVTSDPSSIIVRTSNGVEGVPKTHPAGAP